MENHNLVTLYSVCFKGLFGRNRTVKFTCTDACEQGARPEDSDLQKWIVNSAQEFAGAIRAKRGELWVIRYANSERNVYPGGLVTYTIPITQGVTVWKRDIAEGGVK